MTFAARTLFSGAGSAGVGGYAGASAVAHIAFGGITVLLSFNSDGTVTVASNPAGHTSESVGLPSSWYNPTTPGIGTTHWVRATQVSGDAIGGAAMNTWLQLNAVRTWQLHVNNFGVGKSGVATFEIATDAAGVTIIATGDISLSALTDSETPPGGGGGFTP